jgi:outer membrane protein OmpA-like peptidoglycan-associated protein
MSKMQLFLLCVLFFLAGEGRPERSLPPQLIAQHESVTYLYADFIFAFDSAELSEQAQYFLHNLAAEILPILDRVNAVYLLGHTDSIGDVDYNRLLAQRRADAASNYLQQLGIPKSKLQIKAYGKELPFTTNAIYEGRERNRRVDVILAIR